MNARISTMLAWGAFALITASNLAVLVIALATRSPDPAFVANSINGWITGLVGALILSRRHQHPVGWVLLFISLCLMLTSSTQTYLRFALMQGFNAAPGAMAALWISQWVWIGTFAGLCLLLHLFPTGKPLDKFWRVVMQISLAAQAGMLVLFAAQTPMTMELPDQTIVEYPNPFGLVSIQNEAVFLALILGVLGVPTLLALAAMILRYTRARGIERQQMKWLLYAAALFVIALLLPLFVANPLLDMTGPIFDISNPFLDILIEITALSMAIAVGVALFRYRLYDIDILIRRTLTYGLVVALLAAVYLGSVILLQQIFSGLTGLRQNEIVTVLSTLAIAALFVPLRNKIQEWIDRRFNRKKYDAQAVLSDFAQTVRDETDLENLTVRLMQVVDETMQPKSLSLWLRKTGKGRGHE